MPDGFLGLDIGGTGAKAAVYDEHGQCRGMARRAFQPTVLPNGHVEIAIDFIETAAREATREAVGQSGLNVRAMAISSQGQTFVSLDDHDRPLHPAIMWYDSRAGDQARRLAEVAPEIEPIAAGAKILWLKDHRPEVADARRYLLLPDYLAYRLTGEAITDPETASSTGLCHADHLSYRADALAAMDLHPGQLAQIRPSGTPIGTLRPSAAREWNLSPQTLLVTGTNDQYAGALGAGNCREGIVSETSGTCLAMVTLLRQSPSWSGRFFTGPFPVPPFFFVMAYAKTAGVMLDWIARELGGGKTPAELEPSVSNVPPGSRGVRLYPHFDGMICPTTDANARGAIQGLSLQHSVADLYHAALEGLCFVLRQNLDIWRACGLTLQSPLRCVGGGARSNLWLQMKADVLGHPVERPRVTEAATLGAAMLAAGGQGTFGSVKQASMNFYQPQDVFEPDAKRHAAYEVVYRQWQQEAKQIYPSPR